MESSWRKTKAGKGTVCLQTATEDRECGGRGDFMRQSGKLFQSLLSATGKALRLIIGSRALSFSDPYNHFTCLSVRGSVILSATSELNISETRPESGMVTMGGLHKVITCQWAIDCAYSG